MKSTPEQKKKTSVLLIEDDLDELRTLDQSLKSQKFQTIPCSTPAEALQHVEREEVGIAVLGLCLPKATNTHLMKQLQRKHERLQIIVYAKPESRSSPKAAINAGAFAYLKKSGDLTELTLHIDRALYALSSENSRKSKTNHFPHEDQETLLDLMVQGTASTTGQDFFNALVQNLAKCLDVKFSIVAYWDKNDLENPSAHTLSFWKDDDFGENYKIALKDCPCGEVLKGDPVFYSQSVPDDFPQLAIANTLGIKSYLGFPMETPTRGLIGHLAIFDTKPMPDEPIRWSIMKIFSARAAAELERKFAEEALQDAHNKLEERVQERTAEFLTTNENLKREIEERARVEKALSESKERFDLAVKGTDAGIWDWDVKTNKVYFSPRWKSQLGYEGDEIQGEFFEWENRLHPDDRKRALHTVKEYLEGKTPQYELEHRLQGKDGAYRWILARGVSLSDETGKPYRMAGSHIDITERHQAELQKAEQDLLLSLMLNTGPGCIKRVAADGTLLSMNPAGLELIEACTEEEVIGLLVFELVVPEHRPAFEQMHHNVLNGNTQTLQFELQGLNGTRRWMETYAVPFNNPITKQVEQLAVTHDITDRKKAEQFDQGQKDALERIAGGAPLSSILEHICRLVEAQSHDLICSILLLEGNTLHHGAAPNLPTTFTQKINGIEIGQQAGSCGTAAFRKEPVVVSDIATDPLWERGRGLALSQGLQACWSTPIFSSKGLVLGTFAMYYPNPKSPTQNEQNLVNAATNLAGIAIERKRAEQTLQTSESAIRNLYEITSSPETSFENRVRGLLELGCQRFNLPIGLVTRREGDQFHMIFIRTGEVIEDFVAEGSRIPICDLYCGAALEADAPICFTHASESAWASHPGYATTGLESYLGTKIQVRGDQYGTLCFAGPEPYRGTFTEGDQDFLQLMARWVGGELARNQAEEALLKSEEAYRALFNQNPTMYFTLSSDGIIQSVNQFGIDKLGYSEEELVGDSVLNFFHEEDKSAVQEQFNQCLNNPSQIGQWEFRKVKKNGQLIWVKETARVIQNPQGKLLVLIVCEDITERKRSAEALKEMNLALEHAMPGISQVDHSGCYLTVNDHYATLMGYGPDELLGQSWEPAVHPEDLPIAQEAYEAMLKTGKGEFEARAIRKDGLIFYKQVLMVKADPLKNPGISHHCFMRDITERKEAEATLQNSEQAIRELYEITSSGQSTFEYQIRSLLELGCRRLGLPYGMLTKKTGDHLQLVYLHTPQTDWVEGTLLPLCKTFCGQTMESEGPLLFEHANQSPWRDHPAYEFVHLEAYAGTKVMIGEESFGTLCFASPTPHTQNFTQADVDFLQLMARWIGGELERKHAVDALHEANERLRTLSQQLLTIQENERRQLARDLHDEIGQTLTAVKLNLQTFQQEIPSARAPGVVQDSLQILDHMLKHVRELSLDLRPSMLDDLGLSAAVRWFVNRQAERAGWTAEITIDEGIPMLPPDHATASFRVIQEALTNVMRHAQATHIKVQLLINEDHLEILISDDGVGFDSLKVMEQSASGQTLGLLIMQERVRFLNGYLTIMSQRGKGTQVQARLPVTSTVKDPT